MARYRFHWRDGRIYQGEGSDADDAFAKLGLGQENKWAIERIEVIKEPPEDDNQDKIDLGEFITGEMNRLNIFRNHWLAGQEADPDRYPAFMPPGEWDEQLRAFEEGEE